MTGIFTDQQRTSTDEYEPTDTEMSGTPAPGAAAVSKNIQAGLPRNMVLDPGWFDGDRSKFEDWWRESDYSSRVKSQWNRR